MGGRGLAVKGGRGRAGWAGAAQAAEREAALRWRAGGVVGGLAARAVLPADRAVVRCWRALVSELSEEAQSKRRRARTPRSRRLEQGGGRG